MSISVLLRLLVVMFTSPPFPESFVPIENVMIASCSVFAPSGGLNFIVSAFR